MSGRESKLAKCTAFWRQGAIFLVLGTVLAGCAAPQAGRSGSLPEILSDVRQHPQNRLVSEVDCDRAMASRSGNFPYKAFFSGLFDVAEESGGRVFCASLVEAVIAGDLTESDLQAFGQRREERGFSALGDLLRKLLIAHERL
jgi:hypothetical protein